MNERLYIQHCFGALESNKNNQQECGNWSKQTEEMKSLRPLEVNIISPKQQSENKRKKKDDEITLHLRHQYDVAFLIH